jgi:hypothetical protein
MPLRTAAKQAIEFRLSSGLAFEDPCDIYEAIANLGIDLQFVDIPSLEGMYLQEPETLRICVCAHRPVGRQRYTAAHELGHYVMGHGSQIDTTVDELEKTASVAAEETAAELFARYVLMPPRAVQVAFRSRGFDLASLEPIDVYRAACWLGVGYVTLLNQMLYSLRLVNPLDHERLLKTTPKSIKTSLGGNAPHRDVWPLDRFWTNRRLHAQVGDLIIGLKSQGPTHLLTELDQNVHAVSGVGESVLPLATGGNLTVCASRAAYVGFYEYRYLPE